MKIIRIRKVRKKRVRCEHCGSRLRVDPADIMLNPDKKYEASFECPACNRNNYFVVGADFGLRLKATLKK